MKISDVKTFILRVPLGEKRFYSSQCAFPERSSMLVRIETDDGLIGWGEGGQYGPPQPVASCIDSVLSPLIIGANAAQPVVIWEKLYAHVRDYGPRGPYIEAISAIDIALWDIFGKRLGVPLSNLLGGRQRESIPAYATGGYYKQGYDKDYKKALLDLSHEVESFAESGFQIMKVKIGLLSIEQDIERLQTIRRAAGPRIKLLVDSNHAYNAATAIHMGRRMEEFDIRWFEEPVVPEDRAGYRRVRESINIPVAGGECEYTRYGFRDLITGECVDIAQPDICVCGGLSEFIQIKALASSFGVWVIPHVWGSGVALATALHALSTIPPFPHTANPVPLQNEPVVEFDQSPNPLRDELLIDRITLENSRVSVPAGPGLGIEIDEAVLSRYMT